MSIKPSVVFIKGVHSTTGHDTDSDIGFPQLELEKLFEGATIKVTNDETYDSSKKYIYYDSLNNSIALQDTGHFNCIKNGYYSIANGINHYYTKNGNNYNYNTVPDVSTWAGKWSFSNTIKNKDLYSISSELDRICVGSSYYKKSGNNYIKQNVLTYNTYDNSISVNWDDSNKYIAKNKFIDDPETGDEIVITTWQSSGSIVATSGYYLSVDKNLDNSYIIQLLSLTFNEMGTLLNGTVSGTLYKLPFDLSNASYYIKNDNKFEEILINQSSHVFTTNPATDNEFYIYQKGADWSYPNTEGPEYSILADTDGVYNSSGFPLYTNATITGISKTSHSSYTIYEKTAVKINYNYSGDANSLKFIFTDKDIDGVLAACNLPNDIKQYVHLTNLKYNDK